MIEKSIQDQITELAIEMVAEGKVVKLLCLGKVVGFLMPEGYLEGNAKFTYMGIPVHVKNGFGQLSEPMSEQNAAVRSEASDSK